MTACWFAATLCHTEIATGTCSITSRNAEL